MRGLTDEEAWWLAEALLQTETIIEDQPDGLRVHAIHERLEQRGLVVEDWESDEEWIYWRATKLGKLALECHRAFRLIST